MTGRPGERVTVTVVRSGGVAGLRRAWSLTVDGADAASLAALGRESVWGDDGRGSAGRGCAQGAGDSAIRGAADGFVWTVTMTGDGVERSASLADGLLDAPLQRIVDDARTRGEVVRADAIPSTPAPRHEGGRR